MKKQNVMFTILNNYIVLYRIINFCQTHLTFGTNISLIKLENDCKLCLEKMDEIVKGINKYDSSFLQFKNQLDVGLNTFKVQNFENLSEQLLIDKYKNLYANVLADISKLI